MIYLVSSRCSLEGHSLTSHWFYRQLQSPFFHECKGFGEGRIHSSRISDTQKSGFSSFNCGLDHQNDSSGLYSFKLGSDQSFRAVKIRLGRISVWKIQCADHLGSSYCVLGSRRRKLCRVHMMAGGGCGSSSSIEGSYQTDPFNGDQGDALRASNNAMDTTPSLSGFVCPSVTTVGKSTNIAWHECSVKREERRKLLGQKGCVIWITGLSGSGKSTLACTLDHGLVKRGNLSYVIDGDNLRHGLNKNLGFCVEDRAENIRRFGEVAKLFVEAGIICIASVISPYRRDREACRQLVDVGEFIEVYMNFPLRLCEDRDPKGLYKLARAGKIKGFTGVDDPYEAPLSCEVVMEPIDGRCPTPSEMAARLICYLEEKGFLDSIRKPWAQCENSSNLSYETRLIP